MMTFQFYKIDGSKKELNIQVGKQWNKQQTNNRLLNSLFSLVDNGNGIADEEEYVLLNKLLAKADRIINEKSKNNILDSRELSMLLRKIKNKEIDLKQEKLDTFLNINPDDYTLEGLKKRYPANRYEIREANSIYKILDKKSGYIIMGVSRESAITVTQYEKGLASLERIYDKNGYIIATDKYEEKGNGHYSVRLASMDYKYPLAEILNKDICAKTKYKLPTTGKNFEKHIMMLSEGNILEVISAYRKDYGRDLLDDIDREIGLNFSKNGREMKARCKEHITNCLNKAFGYNPNFKGKSQIINEYYNGDPHYVSCKDDILTIKNLKTNKTKTLDMSKITAGFDYRDAIELKGYLQSIPGEALMDIAVEIDEFYNGQEFFAKRYTKSLNLVETAFAYFEPDDNSLTLNVRDTKNNPTSQYKIAVLHEVGHSIDHVSAKSEFMSNLNKEFKDAFKNETEKLTKKLKNNGYSEQDFPYMMSSEQEMFAECYHYLMTGECLAPELMKNECNECLSATAKIIKKVRSMNDNDRMNS